MPKIGIGPWLAHLPPLGKEEEYAQMSLCCFVCSGCLCGWCTHSSACCLEGKGANGYEVSPQCQPQRSEFYLCFLIILPTTL